MPNPDSADHCVTVEEVEHYRARGYNDDMLPKTADKRNMGLKNYFTLWMGSVHNIPNYAAVGGFLFLGLSPMGVMFALVVSAVLVAAFMVINGEAGSKYGIPFAMHLRSTYGNLGAKLPGFLRGCVAAIAWFGLQTYTGSLALTIILGKLFPGFLELGGEAEVLGIGIPQLISFVIFWLLNLAIGLGGGGILNKFTAILSPLIYVVVIGMTVWAVNAAGGLGNILAFNPAPAEDFNPVYVFLMILNSVIAVWAAPGASVSDFTQNATSTATQRRGQTLSLLVAYVVFAFCSVVILIGASLATGTQHWDITTVIDSWDSVPVVIGATAVFLLTTISTNATGNIIPAGYQLAALFPKKLTYRSGVVIASLISFAIMPWKLMENSSSIYLFLNTIGAVLGPVAGVMIAHYYFVAKRKIDLDALYMDMDKQDRSNPYQGVNVPAYIATIAALVISLSGQIIPALSFISGISWFVGFFAAFAIYLVIRKFSTSQANVETK